MEFLMGLLQMARSNMRVNLCRGDGTVAKHFLHGPQISSMLDEMGRKRMPQHVRRDRLFDTRLARRDSN
jgi:hypothetical protein